MYLIQNKNIEEFNNIFNNMNEEIDEKIYLIKKI